MKKTVIIGAGQMGTKALALINTNKEEIIAFGDNNYEKINSIEFMGRQIPVISIEDACRLNPEKILISVLGDDRCQSLVNQVEESGYMGEILCLKDAYDTFDIRSNCIRLLAEQIECDADIAELGVYKGDTATLLNELFPDKKLYLFDTFEGFDEKDTVKEGSDGFSHAKAGDFADTSAEAVLARMKNPGNCVIRKGYFPDTAAGLEDVRYSFVSLDADLYKPTFSGLEYFIPRIVEGGAIVLHDYNNRSFSGVKKAVQDYEALHGKLKIVPLGDLHGSCVILV